MTTALAAIPLSSTALAQALAADPSLGLTAFLMQWGASGPPPVLTSLRVTAPGSAQIGIPVIVTVTALDQNNNTYTAYAGTVHFTSTDTTALLPADSTLTAGVGTFSATLGAAGSKTITATDTVTAPLTGTSGAIVAAAGAFPPQLQATNPTIAADFAAGLYWGAGASQGSISAWLTAITGTFARSSNATWIDNTGTVKTVTANTIRLVGAGGVRLTSAVTNLCLQSNAFDNLTNWSRDTAGDTVTPAAGISPDGTNNALLVIPATASGFHGVFQSFTFTAVVMTASVFAKAAGYRYLIIDENVATGSRSSFDLVTGTVVLNAFGGAGTITQLGGGWYLCSMTWTATAGAGAINFLSSPTATVTAFTGDGTSGSLLYGGQVTQTPAQRDYVPTTTVTATQAADSLTVLQTFSVVQDTVSAAFLAAAAAGTVGGLFALNNNATTNRWDARTATNAAVVTSGGVTQSNPTFVPPFAAGNFYKYASSVKAGTLLCYAGGSQIASGTPAAMPVTLSKFWIGDLDAGTNNLNSNMARISLWSGLAGTGSDLAGLTT